MDIVLHHREKGQGEPLILLHGNGEDGGYFEHQLDYFSDRYRVIAVDTRGHGQSPRGSLPFTIQQFCCDLCRFMERLGLADAILLGFSDGANIAMAFAMQHPDKVKALILNGGNLDPKGVKRRVQLPIVLGYKIASHFAAKSPEAQKNAEMLGLMVLEPHVDPASLAKITAPTLVISGTKDMIKTAHTKVIAQSIPHARLAILPGDHFIANKRPTAFNQAVEDFLRTV